MVSSKTACSVFYFVVIMVYICMATVARKRVPIVRAAALSFFVSISRVCGPSYAWVSWEVIRRIMLVTASQRLMV